jgi:hypothetical protein
VDEALVDLRPAHQPAFTLKAKPLKREHLNEFVELFSVGNRHLR